MKFSNLKKTFGIPLLVSFVVIIALLISMGVLYLIDKQNDDDVKITEAFYNIGFGQSEYEVCRIPGIVTTKQDTVLMYAEARKDKSDWADTDIILLRSTDGGANYSMKVMASGASEGVTYNNPTMIVSADNTLHFFYCREYGIADNGVFYMRSEDDGATWTDPADVTYATAKDERNCFATGPTHGIELKDGTLIVPVWFVQKTAGAEETAHSPSLVSTLYSLDGGLTWALGEYVQPAEGIESLNETVVVQLSDGRVMLNMRAKSGDYRAVSVSATGYSDWSVATSDKNLKDPACAAGIVSCKSGDTDAILFVNCDSQTARERLTVRLSTDNGESWAYSRVLEANSAGYSDIAVDGEGNVYVAYEVRGGRILNIAKFSMDWLTSGETKPAHKEYSFEVFVIRMTTLAATALSFVLYMFGVGKRNNAAKRGVVNKQKEDSDKKVETE